MAFTKEEQAKLEYSGYRFVGEHGHAAAKICHWTRKSMVNEGVCYKEQFYGVQSHRCLQMSPAVPFCNQKCSFCWRDLSQTRIKWEGEYDDLTQSESNASINSAKSAFVSPDKEVLLS